jgi:beta-phosphoglucomutase-like phosphatase (HAD superfamily)
LYLLAAQRLNVSPAQCIALEDSRNGLLAAKAAGMFAVAIPNSMTRHLDLELADLRLESLADMSLSTLLENAQRVS